MSNMLVFGRIGHVQPVCRICFSSVLVNFEHFWLRVSDLHMEPGLRGVR